MNFKDLFSNQALDYAKFRPGYPAALFQYLSSLTPEHLLAWDCGTGNGQAAIQLVDHFEQVIGTDPSEKQIKTAEKNSRITYQVASAEKSPLSDQSVDLITVAQAFHWFNHSAFFGEVRRVLKPQGVLAIWCYGLCEITPEVDPRVNHFYGETLGPYWEKERKLVEQGYRNCSFPFQEIQPPSFAMEAEWDLLQLMGYLGTWSALQTFIKREGHNPLEKLAPELNTAWGANPSEKKKVRWPLSVRVGRV